jgi:hypothetical protein
VALASNTCSNSVPIEAQSTSVPTSTIQWPQNKSVFWDPKFVSLHYKPLKKINPASRTLFGLIRVQETSLGVRLSMERTSERRGGYMQLGRLIGCGLDEYAFYMEQ